MAKRRTSDRLADQLERMQFNGCRVTIDRSSFWSSRSPARKHDDQLGTWGASGTIHFPTHVLPFNMASYDTMTECAKRGITFQWRGQPLNSGLDIAAA
jgi:hypothetical protein